MSTINDRLALITSGLAETVIYNDGSGPIEVKAIIDHGIIDGAKPIRQASILVTRDDVPNPKCRHIFEIDNEKWTVAPEKGEYSVLFKANNIWSLRIEKGIRGRVCQR